MMKTEGLYVLCGPVTERGTCKPRGRLDRQNEWENQDTLAGLDGLKSCPGGDANHFQVGEQHRRLSTDSTRRVFSGKRVYFIQSMGYSEKLVGGRVKKLRGLGRISTTCLCEVFSSYPLARSPILSQRAQCKETAVIKNSRHAKPQR